MFASLDYRTPVALSCLAALLALNVWPAVGVFALDGPARYLNLATWALMGINTVRSGWGNGHRWWEGIFFPVGAAFQALLLGNSTLKTLVKGGIEWRGTFYALPELRRQVGVVSWNRARAR